MSRRQVHLSSRKHSRFQSLVHLTLCSHLMEHSRFRSFSYWSSFSYLVRCRASVSKLNSNESKFIQYFSFSAHDEVCHILHQRETNFDGQMQGQFFFQTPSLSAISENRTRVARSPNYMLTTGPALRVLFV